MQQQSTEHIQVWFLFFIILISVNILSWRKYEWRWLTSVALSPRSIVADKLVNISQLYSCRGWFDFIWCRVTTSSQSFYNAEGSAIFFLSQMKEFRRAGGPEVGCRVIQRLEWDFCLCLPKAASSSETKRYFCWNLLRLGVFNGKVITHPVKVHLPALTD